MLKEIPFGQNKRYKKALFFLCELSFAILIWAAAQGSSLYKCVWDFPLSISFYFY